MSLEMSLKSEDLSGKPIICANMRVRGNSFNVFILIEDKELQDKMRSDNTLIKKFIKENQKEIEEFLYAEMKKICKLGGKR